MVEGCKLIGGALAMTDSKIRIKNLYKVFGADPKSAMEQVRDGVSKQDLLEKHSHVLGLRDINIDIPEKGISVIMGLSGSGKSTLIRHINRLIEPTEGQVVIDDIDILGMSIEELRTFRRNKASMVFQKFALFPHRTVMQNTAYGLTIQKIAEKEAIERSQHWIERVGLSGFENHYPAQLSGGMQQRVGLARALTTDAEILLMDEAFSALDPLIRTDMQDPLLQLQTELNKTIVFITHDLDEALKLADHLVILKDGYIVQQGEPQNILLNPNDPYIEDFVSDINRARVLRVRSIMTPLQDGVPDNAHGEVDYNDTLESMIAHSGGDTSHSYVVVKDGVPVGTLNMTNLVKALVPRATTSSGPRSSSTLR